MIPFDAVLVLAPSRRLVRLSEDRAVLLGDREHRVLTGDAMVSVASAVDGRRTKQEVIDAACATVGDIEALLSLQQLESAGHVLVRPRDSTAEALAFWHAMGVELPSAMQRLKSAYVGVHGLGESSSRAAGEIVAGLRDLGLQARVDGEEAESGIGSPGAPEARFDLWMVDDYDRSELDAVNRSHLESRVPWALVSAEGATGFVGPIFVPPRTPCWACLVHWLRGNRPVHEYLKSVPGGGASVRSVPMALPTSQRLVFSAACIAVAQALVASDRLHRLNEHLLTVELASLRWTEQYVLRRPQCPACGDPGLMRAKGAKPVALEGVAKQRPHDSGYRQRSAGDTKERFRRLVAPHVGPVAFLQPMPNRPSPLHAVQVSGYLVPPPGAERIEECVRVCAGKGRSNEQAEVSALFEALERRSGQYEGDELRIRATLGELGAAALSPSVLHGFSARQYARRAELNLTARDRSQFVPEPLESHTAIDWIPAWSLTSASKRYVPFSYCFAGAPAEAGAAYCPTNGNGVAAGTCIEEAILQGILELVERDAAAIWWYNRIRRPTFSESLLRGDPYADSLLTEYVNRGIRTYVLDLTQDIGIPVCVAVAHHVYDGREVVALGFGCHLSFDIALRRALTELNQLGTGIRPGSGRPFLDTDRLDDRRYLAPAEDERAKGFPAPNFDGPDLKADVEECLRRLGVLGLEAFVVDKTRPDLELAVAQVVVPGLRHFWPRFAPGRLYDVPVRMGWLHEALSEEALNPVPLTL
jgi:ribosomal protein S12 methylthiotransferase accessory factor